MAKKTWDQIIDEADRVAKEEFISDASSLVKLTNEEIEATIQLARSLPLDLVVFSPLRVTPGTQMYGELLSAGKITSETDPRAYGHHSYLARSFCPIPDTEMRRLYRRAYAQFYFRLPVALNVLRQVRSTTQLKTIVNGLLRKIFSTRE